MNKPTPDPDGPSIQILSALFTRDSKPLGHLKLINDTKKRIQLEVEIEDGENFLDHHASIVTVISRNDFMQWIRFRESSRTDGGHLIVYDIKIDPTLMSSSKESLKIRFVARDIFGWIADKSASLIIKNHTVNKQESEAVKSKPPSDASVLFDVQSESSTIKQGKDGSYKLVMEDVETVHWETGKAEAGDGYYSAKKYAKKFNNYYGENSKSSAYQTFALADGTKEKCKFVITDAKYKKKANKLVYEIEPFSQKQFDKITGIEGEAQSKSSVYSWGSSSDAESYPTSPGGWGERWRPEWMPNGKGRNLYRKYLRWTEMSGADLRDADLRGTDMIDTNLSGADLSGADLRDADIRVADLNDAVLERADLRNADLQSTDLIGADLERAILTGANMIFNDLTGADLTGAILRNTDLRIVDLIDADLRFAVLSGSTDIHSTDLLNADLRFADLTGVRHLGRVHNADKAIWGGTICPDGSMNIGTSPCAGDQLIPLA